MQCWTLSKEQELFRGCASMADIAERNAYLRQACAGDSELQQRILRLIEAHQLAEAATLEAFAGREAADLPEMVDHYRIVRTIGEGGMGIVYEADQTEPVRRRVALKAIKPGMDTKQVVARFQAERQALAALDHPFIAKVFDAGQTASGRPYFVMEYVEGLPLLDFCESGRTPLRKRIELAVSICRALQHAHQKGLIHRDLKPSNILVTSECGMAIPKIIDFGIAKAVQSGVSLTRMDQKPGTPAYMSPEQAGWKELDIDTRSDIYSLGVVLYELLTGCLPLHSGQQNPWDAMPVKPSARVGPPASRELAGDLDWIVLKALETDRERRYATASALADDLERYLSARPVSARAPTLAYRCRKFAERNRVQVAAAGLAAICIGGSLAAGAVAFVKTTRAETVARQEAATAHEVSRFLVDLFGMPDPNAAPGSATTVEDLLRNGTARIETDLEAQPEVRAKLFRTLSHVYEARGEYRRAIELAGKALAVRPAADDLEAAEALVSLGRARHRMSHFEQSIQAFERAVAIRVRLLGEDHLDVSWALNQLGAVYGQIERFDEAVAAHKRALAIQQRVAGPEHILVSTSYRGLGIVEDRRGNREAAAEFFRLTLPITRKRYGQNHPVVADALQNLAESLRDLGRCEEALAMFQEALQIQLQSHGPNHPGLAYTSIGLGRTLQELGRLDQALPYLESAVRVRQAALGPEHVRTAEALKHLGLLRLLLGEAASARLNLAKSVEIFSRVYGPAHSDTLRCHRDIGLGFLQAGLYAQALPHLEKVTTPDTPPHIRPDLRDRRFDGLRSGNSATFPKVIHQ